MKTIKINLTQPRVANVAGNATTMYAILKDSDSIAYIVRKDELDEWREWGFKTAALAEVTHPAIMAGNAEEIESDIRREIEEAVLAEGVCVANNFGALFVK